MFNDSKKNKMKVITKEELEQSKEYYIRELKKSVFIYPTDSIYGIGCDATNQELVNKVRELKNSTLQPFSIIAPSKQWVYENCEVPDYAEEWVEKLGYLVKIDGVETRFTLILKLKNPEAVAKNVLQGLKSIGVRMPKHWITELVSEMKVPIITTSANPTGGNFMTAIEELHPRIEKGIDYFINVGPIRGKPSTLIFLDKGEVSFKKR